MKVTCQACNASFLAPDDKIRGRVAKYNCRTCGSVIVADGTALGQAPAAAAPAPAPSSSPVRSDGWSEPPMAPSSGAAPVSVADAPRDSMAGWDAVPVDGALPRLPPPGEPAAVPRSPKSFSIEVDIDVSKPSSPVDDARPTERSAPPGESLDELDWGEGEPTSRSEPPAPVEAEKPGPAGAFSFPLFGAPSGPKPTDSSRKQSPSPPAASPSPPAASPSPAAAAARPAVESPAKPAAAAKAAPSPTAEKAAAPAASAPAAQSRAVASPAAAKAAAAPGSPSPATPAIGPGRASVIPAPLTDEIAIDMGDERDGPPSGLTDLRMLRGDRASEPPPSSGARVSRVDFDDLLSLSGPASPSPAHAPSSPVDWGAAEPAPLWGPPPAPAAAAAAPAAASVPEAPPPRPSPAKPPARPEVDKPAAPALVAASEPPRVEGARAGQGRKGLAIAAALGALVLGVGVLTLAGGKGQDSPSSLVVGARTGEAVTSSSQVAADTTRKQPEAEAEGAKKADPSPEALTAAAPVAQDKPSSGERPSSNDKASSGERPASHDKPSAGGGPSAGDKPATAEKGEAKKAPDKPAEKASDKPAAPAGGEFNRDAARAALASAASSAAGCGKPDGPKGVAKVSITFAPSGRVTQSTVNGPPFAGTAVGGCIAATFRRATVPPFSGDPVAVSKSVQIQ